MTSETLKEASWQPIATAPKNRVILLCGWLEPATEDVPMYSNLHMPARATGYWDEIDEAWAVVGSTYLGPWFHAVLWMDIPDTPENLAALYPPELRKKLGLST